MRHTLQSLGHYTHLLISHLHQSILSSRILLAEENIEWDGQRHGREPGEQRLPPDKGQQKRERHDNLEETAGKEVVERAELGHPLRINTDEIDGRLFSLGVRFVLIQLWFILGCSDSRCI